MRKGIWFIMVLTGFIFIPLQVVAQFAGGTGTPGDPYQVATAAQLNEVRNYLTSNFIQTADIDLGGDDPGGDFYNSGLGWVPIGQFGSGNEFEGSYWGDGYKITGLYMERIAAGVRAGLFGYISEASLFDVHLVGVDVTGNSPVGGLLGENSNGSVSNCTVTGTVAGVTNVGGLVGMNGSGNGLVTNSYANVAVSGSNSGVLVGNNSSATIQYSFAEGTSPNAGGGLVGRNNFGTVINSYATATGATGGLVGYNTGTVENSYSTGTADTGGLIADDGGGTVTNSYWNTETSGQATSEGGTGLTDAEMKQQASYNNWDFSTIWAIDEGVSYPYLINNPPIIPLDAPALVYPGDEATGIEDSVTLVWNSVPNADSYTLERAESDDFIDLGEPYLLEESITDTSFFIPHLPPNLTLYWRIKAVSTDQESEWSETFSFSSSENSSMPDDIMLISPPDLAEDQPLEITFNWHSDVFADEYEFQLDETETFTSPVATYTGTDTSFAPGSLTAGTTYYWRVRGVSDYGEISWADSFSFTTEETLPDSPELLHPLDGATGIEDTVIIRWSSVEGADSYTLETSDVENFDSESNFLVDGIEDTTFFGDGIPPSVTFYWRVKAIVGEQESEWSEVFNFTTSENSAKPESITLISPVDMAEELPLEVTFLWNSDAYAEEYHIQLSEDESYNTFLANQALEGDTTYTYSELSEGITYYWRVRGINVYHEGDWSETFSFTTAGIPLNTPQLIYPENGATGLEDTLTASWHPVEEAISYIFEGSEEDNFDDPNNYYVEGITDTTLFIPELPPARQLYWRVKAVAETKESAWSETFTFTTTPGSSFPDSIKLISPINMAENQSLELAFTWHSDSDANEYQFQLDEQDAFTSPNIDSTTTDTTLVSETLADGTVYYWRVRGINEYGEAAWSQVFSFTTEGTPPPVPLLISPEDGAVGLEDTVRFVWSALSGALSYEVEGSPEEDFSSGVFGADLLIDTALTVYEFPPSTKFYWRVRGVLEEGPGEWSQVFEFTTSETSSFPNIPVLHLPEDEAEDVDLTFEFSWFPEEKSDNYDLEISTTEIFDPAEFSFTEHADTLIMVEDLHGNTEYFWRVRGNNEYGTGEWSETRSFKTKLVTSLGADAAIPKEFALRQNYPNPFNPATTIRYALPVAAPVTVIIYNSLGQQVAIFNEGVKNAGHHEIRFDASALASGIYLYRMEAGKQVFIRKMMLIK